MRGGEEGYPVASLGSMAVIVTSGRRLTMWGLGSAVLVYGLSDIANIFILIKQRASSFLAILVQNIISLGLKWGYMQLTVDRDRLVRTMETQAAIGETSEGGLDRLALSESDGDVRDWFLTEMERAGLSVRIDKTGNMFGRREGKYPDAAPVLVGSHLDSQPNGGIYDGALGVVAALETVRTLDDEGVKTDRPVEVVNWTNEEGTRFQPAKHASGSAVWAGDVSVEEAYETTDKGGVRFEDALDRKSVV